MRQDKIVVYASTDGPRSQRIRWTRKSGANGKRLSASCEGYSRVASAVSNIERTQKPPYEVIMDKSLKS